MTSKKRCSLLLRLSRTPSGQKTLGRPPIDAEKGAAISALSDLHH
jgi:hypothetical protein